MKIFNRLIKLFSDNLLLPKRARIAVRSIENVDLYVRRIQMISQRFNEKNIMLKHTQLAISLSYIQRVKKVSPITAS